MFRKKDRRKHRQSTRRRLSMQPLSSRQLMAADIGVAPPAVNPPPNPAPAIEIDAVDFESIKIEFRTSSSNKPLYFNPWKDWKPDFRTSGEPPVEQVELKFEGVKVEYKPNPNPQNQNSDGELKLEWGYTTGEEFKFEFTDINNFTDLEPPPPSPPAFPGGVSPLHPPVDLTR